jgi:hypothetical protein
LVSISLQTDGVVNEADFLAAIASLNGSLLRLKGTVCFKNRTRFVEVINGRVSEKDPPAGLPKTAFTAIGWRIDKAALHSVFHSCFQYDTRP